MVYNKEDITKEVSEKMSISKVAASLMIDIVFNSIKNAIKRYDKVSIAGFGIFERKIRGVRKARNPRTGESVDVPPGYKVKFRRASALQEFINEK